MSQQDKNLRRARRKKEDKLVGKIVKMIVLTLVVVGLVLGFTTYHFVSSALRPLDSQNSEVQLINIPTGSSNRAIGEILENNEIIKSGLVFNYFTKFNNFTGFQAGNYQFSPNMTLSEISEQLQIGGLAADQADARVTVREGIDIDLIADAVAEATDITKEEFIAVLEDDQFFEQMLERYPRLLTDASKAQGVKFRLEGYLFPATYDYYKGMTPESLIGEMVAKTNLVMSNYFDKIEESDLTIHETLTLASLVEKEGTTDEDRRKIAQVFFNRLAIDMPLQSDVAILYAWGEHKEFVFYRHLEIDSPFNLYVHRGLGPGPMNSPSEHALQAVLDPLPNDYLFFVADLDTGNVFYSKTLEEHDKLVQKYVNSRMDR